MKKTIIFEMILFIMLALLVACKRSDSPATLESMKKSLKNAGYTIIENYTELYEPHESSINSTGGFSFIFHGAHGAVNTPVLEFQDTESAEFYAGLVNESGYFLAIMTDRFLTILEAHDGVAHADDKIFFENLINGKTIK